MSAYNTVEVKRLVPCRRCGDAGVIKVQFAYGDTQQYSYSMGDEIKWGGNDVGTPTDRKVQLLGTPEYCPTCGLNIPEEYVICVDKGRLADCRLEVRKPCRRRSGRALSARRAAGAASPEGKTVVPAIVELSEVTARHRRGTVDACREESWLSSPTHGETGKPDVLGMTSSPSA